MEYGKKYRVLPISPTFSHVHNLIVEKRGGRGATQKAIDLTGRLAKIEEVHPGEAWFWLEDWQVELVPEELQDEDIATILLYYSL